MLHQEQGMYSEYHNIHGLLLVWKTPGWVANFVFTLNFWSPFHRATYFFWELCCFHGFLKVCSEVYQYMVCLPPLGPFRWLHASLVLSHSVMLIQFKALLCRLQKHIIVSCLYIWGFHYVWGSGIWVLGFEVGKHIEYCERRISFAGHSINMQQSLFHILRYSWSFCFPVSKIDEVLVFAPSIQDYWQIWCDKSKLVSQVVNYWCSIIELNVLLSWRLMY